MNEFLSLCLRFKNFENFIGRWVPAKRFWKGVSNFSHFFTIMLKVGTEPLSTHRTYTKLRSRY